MTINRHIIVTMAGHSRRFKEEGYKVPKAFIRVGDRMMIEHVVDMFGQEDHFHFVVNSEQIREYSRLIEKLSDYRRHTNIVIIEPHNHGPTYSAVQVEGIPAGAEVLLSYCDFFVDWDYEHFNRSLSGYDAAAPSFRGFHPASFGETMYAYMQVDENNQLIELKEKASFTNSRHEEHASAGLYYFKNYALFKKYGDELLSSDQEGFTESYTSLLFNSLVSDGQKVLVYEVDKFICLGTPADLEQYNFWWTYFHEKKRDDCSYVQTNLIPMAGRGHRFALDGYRVQKPLIQVGSSTMVERACKSFPQGSKWIFVSRCNEIQKIALEKAVKNLDYEFSILQIDEVTMGQASTCLLAEDHIDQNLPLFIASCDYETIYNSKKLNALLNDESIDGIVWTYRLGHTLYKNPNAFAYCRVDANGVIQEIIEKQTISDNPSSDPMALGSFWYRRGEDFSQSANAMIKKNITVNNEYYVATSINQLIKDGKKFVIFDVDQWISYGDPFELKLFEYWQDLFRQMNRKQGVTLGRNSNRVDGGRRSEGEPSTSL